MACQSANVLGFADCDVDTGAGLLCESGSTGGATEACVEGTAGFGNVDFGLPFCWICGRFVGWKRRAAVGDTSVSHLVVPDERVYR